MRSAAARSAGGIRRRIDRHQIHHQADLPVGLGAIDRNGRRMGPQQILRHLHGLRPIAPARRVAARDVAVVHRDPGLVERGPHRHTIAERAKHQLRVFGEPLRRIGVCPAAAIFERRRQVPMVERHARLDAVFEQRVDEPRIEIEALRIRPASSLGQHAAPGGAEAIRLNAELAHQPHIVGEPAVVIARDVAVVAAVRSFPGRWAKRCQMLSPAPSASGEPSI